MNEHVTNWRRIGIACFVVVVLILVVALGLSWWGINHARRLVSDFGENPLLAARLLIKGIPEIEEVSCNEEEGTMTLRSKETGEEITVRLDAINEGRVTISSDQGEFSIEGGDGVVHVTSDTGKLSFSTAVQSSVEFPDWVPVSDSLEVDERHVLNHDTGMSGGLNGLTENSVEDIAQFYDDRLTSLGFEVIPTQFSNAEHSPVLLTAEDRSTGRVVVVNITRVATMTRVALTFNQENSSP